MPRISEQRLIHRESDFSNFVLLKKIHKEFTETIKIGVAFGLLRGCCSWLTQTSAVEGFLWGFCFGFLGNAYVLFREKLTQFPPYLDEMIMTFGCVVIMGKLSTAIISNYLENTEGNHQSFLFICYCCELIRQTTLSFFALIEQSLQINIQINVHN